MTYFLCAASLLMLTGVLLYLRTAAPTEQLWRHCMLLSVLALGCTVAAWFTDAEASGLRPWLHANPLGAVVAVLVQLLGTVIISFSARYLAGEPRQRSYIAALSGVLAAVHLLLLADHWLVLIAAWAFIGFALQHLLCFYADRPFALLAAHKKRMADRLADGLLLLAAALAWVQVGSGSLSDLWLYLAQYGASITLQISAICLVLAVVLRTALMPVHGWLIQVMEAPTPVSALLHAGIVNLGGYVLIRFAPLLEQAMLARWLLFAFGLGTAVLAGLVMLTRISIKVRLAWSTAAQMGFMLLECGLGLYTLAALHLVGHSLYKAHAFLSASSAVRNARLQALHTPLRPTLVSLLAAPAISVALVLLMQLAWSGAALPWWWSGVLGLAWAPLLWLPTLHQPGGRRSQCVQGAAGLLMVAGLTAVALFVHTLPLGLQDAPDHLLGPLALLGMAMLYACLATLQWRPESLEAWRRRSYAGFYVDEVYTRLVLQLWPARWTPQRAPNHARTSQDLVVPHAPK